MKLGNVKSFYPLLFLITTALIWWFASYYLQQSSDPALLRRGDRVAFLKEDEDLLVYFSGQGWIKWNAVLLESGYSEYPAMGLFYLNWPKIFFNDFHSYQLLLRCCNLLLYVLTGFLLWRLVSLIRPSIGIWRLWFLPSVLYYSFNVFDIFPVFLVLLSLYLIFKQHFRSGWFIYGLAIMTKIYPLFLLPLFWFLTRNRASKPMYHYFFCALLPILSLVTGTIVSGGALAVISPVILQLSRTAEPGSLFSLLPALLPFWPHYRLVFHTLFQILQYTVPLIWLLLVLLNRKLNFFTNLTLASLTLLTLVVFNPFYSNQWWLWVLPFLILTLPVRFWWLPVIYDLLNYLQLPIIFQLFGRLSFEFNMVVLVRSLVGLVFIFILIRQLPARWWAVV